MRDFSIYQLSKRTIKLLMPLGPLHYKNTKRHALVKSDTRKKMPPRYSNYMVRNGHTGSRGLVRLLRGTGAEKGAPLPHLGFRPRLTFRQRHRGVQAAGGGSTHLLEKPDRTPPHVFLSLARYKSFLYTSIVFTCDRANL